ncbi:sterol desaturase family protein [Bombella intestini]|uniref:sterol desaturase family protein n=1 Tax=Bombella intestini TaxID=1539051 RepID=UPI000985D1A8
MSESSSRLIRVSDPTNSSAPHQKISGKAPPVRIFKKDWMEAFTLISFRQFLIYCFFFEVVLLYANYKSFDNPGKKILFLFSGFVLWFFAEYVLHRFVFHFISERKSIQRLVYIFHGNHHIQPNHPYRTLMPIVVTLPIALLIWAISVYGAGFSLGSSFFMGFFSGYVLYDTIHYATHNFNMKMFPLNIWKRHHLLHHYRTEEHNYSISLPWLDTLFRTRYKKNK